MVRLEEFPGRLCLHLEDDNHECAHEEGTVSHLVILVAAVVEKSVVFVLRIGEETDELPYELVNHGQVQRTKIVVECVVDELLID